MLTTTESIWAAFHKELLAFISHAISDKDTSWDILQDVFLKIHTRRHTLKDEGKLVSWVWQITRNTVLDHFRTKKQFTELPDDLVLQHEENPFNATFAQCMSPFIHNLSPLHKEAIKKVDIEGMPQKQFAEQEGISYTAAKSRVQRARLHLKDLFLECCAIPADKYGNILDMIPQKNCRCKERPSPHALVSSM
ncbi:MULTISPECIES: RNA polymerase sigma factor SigZ [unclassified Imperialibacter]|uniref:RNA polymerase sigma factor SigZ n=1 Tax=unclassified Imperialibacter TaxID=2629706 RepID=UPI00125A3C44|nr:MULTISPECIES: RNA polymerase sigma factor SigZ [unclassified Imperialibacter]CAD5257209.1 RNA polymerase sigma factor SigZ [Imperialibacter sp. 75]CAD5260083.1 RNA polymerase sigma factor SigZ [Imperialibacter sp. 89]VVT25794.1 RNA polymerase sigma factor SigZ [Imperialibacter sp. EC-SDR9]